MRGHSSIIEHDHPSLVVHLPDGVDEWPGGVDDALGPRRPLLPRHLVAHLGAARLPLRVLHQAGHSGCQFN